MSLTPLNVKDPTYEAEVLAEAIVIQLLKNMGDQDYFDFGSSLRCEPLLLFDEDDSGLTFVSFALCSALVGS